MKLKSLFCIDDLYIVCGNQIGEPEMRNGTTKLSVNLPAESVDELRAYAKKHGITMTEALRRAMGLQKFIDQEIAEGAKVLLEHKSGVVRQLVTA